MSYAHWEYLVAETPELELPPIPSFDTAVLGDEFIAALGAEIEKWGHTAAASQWEWDARHAARANSIGPAELAAIRDWLNGDGLEPEFAKEIPYPLFKGLPLPCAVLIASRNPARRTSLDVLVDMHDISDLRAVVEAASLVDVCDTVDAVVDDYFFEIQYPRGLFRRVKAWPFFVTYPDRLDRALGLAGDTDRSDMAVGMAVLAMFPTIPGRYVPLLADIAAGDAKTNRREAQDLLKNHPRVLDIAAEGLKNGKVDVRADAAAWIGRIGDHAGIDLLQAALAREKREQPQAAMLWALRVLGCDISAYLDPPALAAAAKKGLAGRHPTGMDWFPLDDLPSCRWADGTPVDPSTIMWWAVLSAKLKDPAGAGLIPLYVSLLDRDSQETLGTFVLDTWVAHDTRVVPCTSVYGGDYLEYQGTAIGEKGLLALTTGTPGYYVHTVFQKFVREHTERRAQIEALMVAAAYNDDPAAIQLVVSISHRFKKSTVRKRAALLIDDLAERRGWTPDELADRTIPTAGFDHDGALALDFGSRSFTGTIARSKTGSFSVALTAADGKPVRSLPKTGATDDPDLADASRGRLATSRKELTQVAKLQTPRLFDAMCVGRTWDVGSWRELYEHPVMRHLVAALVWQIWDDPALPDAGAGEAVEGAPITAPEGRTGVDPHLRTSSESSYRLFRPTVDGELLNADDEPISLPGRGRVGLAHLVTLTADEAEQWRTHLFDYEVVPLFDQLSHMGMTFDPGAITIDDHQGWMSDSYTIRDSATERGYTPGPALYRGSYFFFCKDFPGCGITAVIWFTGYSPGEPIPAAVNELGFFRSDDLAHMSDETDLPRPIPLSEVPPALLAESYADYVYVAGEGGFDSEWATKCIP